MDDRSALSSSTGEGFTLSHETKARDLGKGLDVGYAIYSHNKLFMRPNLPESLQRH